MRPNIQQTHLDIHFITATNQFMGPDFDWRWLKAQAFQESLFDPGAVSSVGAMGVMQFMPDTWADQVSKGKAAGDPYKAEDSIYAGAQYLHQLMRSWTSYRPEIDRLALSFASYNAGFGNLIKAQKRQNGVFLYKQIIDGLPDVTGSRNASETITYVERIFGYYNQLVLDDL